MAMVISSSCLRKPSTLKDYLLDDFGSCSSSGFQSLPRRQCCVAVHSLIEIELCGGRCSPSKISCAIRKASNAIVGAMKLLPLKSTATKKSILPRSFSRGVGKRRLLKKENEQRRDYEIERWISTAESMTMTITSGSSSSNGDSWSESDSEFTLTCSSFEQNGVVPRKRSSSTESKRCRVTVPDESMEPATTKDSWSEEDEENSSPVSVLNFFREENEEEGSSSPFTLRLNNLEGTTEKLMQKLKHFESRLSLTMYSDEDSPLISVHSSPSPQHNALYKDDEDAKRLLRAIKAKTDVSDQACESNMDGLLLDFLVEGLVNGKERKRDFVEETLMKEAEDWVIGKRRDEVAVGWKVKEKRKVYAKDMEEGGIWRSNDVDKEEVLIHVEAQVYSCLIDELMEEIMLL